MEGAGSLFISPATWSNHGRGTMPARCVVCGVGGSITCCGLKGVCRSGCGCVQHVAKGQDPARVGEKSVPAQVCVCACVR